MVLMAGVKEGEARELIPRRNGRADIGYLVDNALTFAAGCAAPALLLGTAVLGTAIHFVTAFTTYSLFVCKSDRRARGCWPG